MRTYKPLFCKRKLEVQLGATLGAVGSKEVSMEAV